MYLPREYYVYIMSNVRDTVVYTGVTGQLETRVSQHKRGTDEGFTKKYRTNKLVYYEIFNNPLDAINREKQIKGYRRSKKDALIDSINPSQNDLATDWE